SAALPSASALTWNSRRHCSGTRNPFISGALDASLFLNYSVGSARRFHDYGLALGREPMRQLALGCVLIGNLIFVPGCVERRFVVTTDPPGAVVVRNGTPIGA